LGRTVPGEHVHFRKFDDELLLLDLEGGHYFALNAVGARMWLSFAAGKSPAEVVGELAPDYDVDPDILLRDCVRLADDLVERGLLREALSP
jgi:hypothetical protein